ncbi:YlzJ-like family protein [Terrilactibacillus laevilacticus]|uniref:YlzJ-like family protein n=1 Tax=Terrilactibacillus laevilacticus TaxID=1380157 RepID=A0ABW5PPP1_9BACI|nr:YlzJ-like family protein [Terrilactibacillus laevilacticus]
MYTIYPEEVIFSDNECEKNNQMTLTVQGVTLVVEVENHNQLKIVRLISSDPQDFLDERFQPGEQIIMKPLLRTKN